MIKEFVVFQEIPGLSDTLDHETDSVGSSTEFYNVMNGTEIMC